MAGGAARSTTIRNDARGITLIEVMVVVVLIAVLASIAVPGYRQYLLRAHRTEAKRALLDVAAAQERFYLQNDTYAGPSGLTTSPPTGLGIPALTENGHYAVAITVGDVNAFSATATAQGSQADDTRCATFAIDQTAEKTATSAGCWD